MMTRPNILRNTIQIVGTKRKYGRTVYVIKDTAGRSDDSLAVLFEVPKQDLEEAIHDFAICCGFETRSKARDSYGLPVYQGMMDKIDWRVACTETDVLLGCNVNDED